MTQITRLATPGQPRQIMVDGEHWILFEAYMKLVEDHSKMRQELQAKQRTQAEHNQQFAEIKDLWETLPEWMADAPYAKSPEHLRKHALISTGYSDTDIIDCGSHEVAVAVAPVVAKRARMADGKGRERNGYAIVTVRGSLVTCSTAQSQSYKAMDRDAFRESKRRVLDFIHGMLNPEGNG